MKYEDRDRAISADDYNTESKHHTGSGIGSEYSINSHSKEDDDLMKVAM